MNSIFLFQLNTGLAGKAASNHIHNAATSNTNGFMSSADKMILDKINGNYIPTTQGNGFTRVDDFAKFADTNNAYFLSGGVSYLISLVASSDERIKANITDTAVKALDIINLIRHKSFDYTSREFGSHVDIGYIAQELINLVPEAVIAVPQDKAKFGYDTLYQIDYAALVPYLTKAVQELAEQVDSLCKVISPDDATQM